MLRRIALLCTLALIAGCSSDSKNKNKVDPKFDVEVTVRSLSGVVRDSDGDPVVGAIVRQVGGDEALTDAKGAFALLGVTPGEDTTIEIDGTGVNAAGSRFGIVRLAVRLGSAAQAVLAQPITLPDLLGPNGASDELGLTSGVVEQDFTVSDASGQLVLRGEAQTQVTFPNNGSGTELFIAIQPVSVDALPAPLPEGRTALVAALVDLSGATFAPALDLALPAPVGLADGDELELLRFDALSGEWARPAGDPLGEVDDATQSIQAPQAAGVGGWYVAVVEEDLTCTTTLVGRVVDFTTQQGLPGVAVRTSTGDFATTDLSGVYRIENVAAYDLVAFETQGVCEPIDVDLAIETPPITGGIQDGSKLLAGQIVIGGETESTTFEVEPNSTGGVAGLALGDLDPSQLVVVREFSDGVSGALVTEVPVSASGAFFLDGLDPGGYEAAYQFDGQADPTFGVFEIGPSFLTTIALQEVPDTPPPPPPGTGLTVTVLAVANVGAAAESFEPVDGATVRLHGVGTGMTGPDGKVNFANPGPTPYSVSAMKDVDFGIAGSSFVVRQASTVVDHGAADDGNGRQISIPLTFEGSFSPPNNDATIAGSVNVGPFVNEVTSIVALGTDAVELGSTTVFGGTYSMAVPSGVPFTLVALVEDFSSSSVITGIVLRDIGALGSGQTSTQNFDLTGPEFIPFDQPVDVSFVNVFDATTIDATVELNLYNADGSLKASFEPYFDSPDDTTVLLPLISDLPNSGPVSVETDIFGDLNGRPLGANCEIFTDTLAVPFTFDVLSPPEFAAPQDNDTLSLSQTQNLVVRANLSGATNNGLTFLALSGAVDPSQIAGVDLFVWTIFAVANTDTIDLGELALPDPVFHSGQDIALTFESLVVSGTSVSLESFFDENLAEQASSILADADVICSALSGLFFFVN